MPKPQEVAQVPTTFSGYPPAGPSQSTAINLSPTTVGYAPIADLAPTFCHAAAPGAREGDLLTRYHRVPIFFVTGFVTVTLPRGGWRSHGAHPSIGNGFALRLGVGVMSISEMQRRRRLHGQLSAPHSAHRSRGVRKFGSNRSHPPNFPFF